MARLGASEMQAHVLSNDGVRIGFETRGAGPPLVLVHGTGTDRSRWAPVVPTLATRFTLHLVDRRGRGISGDAPDYSFEREFADVAAVAEAAGPTYVLGHSHGALCALEAALLTGAITRLVLYEPSFRVAGNAGVPEEERRRIALLVARGLREEALEAFLRQAGVPEASIVTMRSDPTWSNRVESAHTFIREHTDAQYVFEPSRFRSLSIPTLLIAGSESPAVLREATQAVREALSNSRIETLTGQGHDAVTSAPADFARAVMTLLSESPNR